jgi:hypothetical protein
MEGGNNARPTKEECCRENRTLADKIARTVDIKAGGYARHDEGENDRSG